MKNTFISSLLLATILAGGLWFSAYTKTLCNSALGTLETCSSAVAHEDWDTANAELNTLRNTFSAKRPLLAGLLRHDVLDDIEIALVRTQAAANAMRSDLFEVECASLTDALEELTELDTAVLSNIF